MINGIKVILLCRHEDSKRMTFRNKKNDHGEKKIFLWKSQRKLVPRWFMIYNTIFAISQHISLKWRPGRLQWILAGQTSMRRSTQGWLDWRSVYSVSFHIQQHAHMKHTQSSVNAHQIYLLSTFNNKVRGFWLHVCFKLVLRSCFRECETAFWGHCSVGRRIRCNSGCLCLCSKYKTTKNWLKFYLSHCFWGSSKVHLGPIWP